MYEQTEIWIVLFSIVLCLACTIALLEPDCMKTWSQQYDKGSFTEAGAIKDP